MMKTHTMWLGLTLALGLVMGCGASGTPGVSGKITLSPDILLKPQTATKIVVGAFGAEQLRADAWPDRWANAKWSQTIDNLTPKDYEYSFVTGSSERLYLYAYLDQNGSEDAGNTEPNAIDIGGEVVKDVIGRYDRNPVVPIDEMLNEINIELLVEMEM